MNAAAYARAADGLVLDRATAPADPGRLAPLAPCSSLTIDLALDHAVREAAHLALCHGWQARDLLAFADSRLDVLTRSYLADVLGLTAQWCAAAGWLTDLERLGHRAWWSAGQAHATQWARRHRLEQTQAVTIAVDVVALLTHLPRTAAAQPETPAASGASAGVLVRELRIVNKIDALFARAVATTFGDEAQACAAKGQELLLRYASPAVSTLGVVRRSTDPARPHPQHAARRRPRPDRLAIPA